MTVYKTLKEVSDFPATKYVRLAVQQPSAARGDYVRLGYHSYSEELLSSGVKALSPLVLVMGWTATKEDWHCLPQKFSDKRAVFAIDNRAVGESYLIYPNQTENDATKKKIKRGVPQFTMEDMAYDVYQFIKYILSTPTNNGQKQHTSVVLCGLSMGGFISQTLVLRYPNIVNKLILFSTAPGGGPHAPYIVKDEQFIKIQMGMGSVRTKKELIDKLCLLNRLMLHKHWNDDTFVRKMVVSGRNTRRPFKVIVAQLSAIMKFNVKSRLKEIKMPTLIIHGTHDLVLHPSNATYMAQRIPNSQLQMLTDEGHYMHVTPEGLAVCSKLINNFLNNKTVVKSKL